MVNVESDADTGGAGSSLPAPVLITSGICTVIATIVSAMSIYLQLKNYRKPLLQRMVIRIMVMIPMYAIASLISLFSLNAAFFIDVIRDIYEAFVIYCFFNLLLGYLGGERSLLILLHGREPKPSPFPVSIIKTEFDVSDPYTFLFLKRGIMQYVQVKPLLAVATFICKLIGKYNEGDLRANSGYLYISIVYNFSICLSLYCLAMFWLCVNDDLTPFRPMPKFLCVKGILFFSFWQSLFISILVAAGAITSLGPYTDSEHISLGLTDSLICIEMPFFAIAHMYAFSYTDYIDRKIMYAARMPILYAIRDAFGLKDVWEDMKTTLGGKGMDYREFEPAEGFIHQGSGRDRRIRAGLRYAQGGQKKYWLPMPIEQSDNQRKRADIAAKATGVVDQVVERITGGQEHGDDYAPLFSYQAQNVVHDAPDMQQHNGSLLTRSLGLLTGTSFDHAGFELPFDDPQPEDDDLYAQSRRYIFGDYNYPTIDVSSEYARETMWREEERVLRDEHAAYFHPIRHGRGEAVMRDYGATRRESPLVIATDDTYGSPEVDVKGKGRVDERLVDHDENRDPEGDGMIRLPWTKLAKPGTRSRVSSTVSNGSASGAAAKQRHEAANNLLSPRDTPSPTSTSTPTSSSPTYSQLRSRTNSQNMSRSPHGKTVVTPIRSDAVDLVVQDEHAAEDEMTKERRKGEPAVRGSGLRMVYHRGYFDARKAPHDTHGSDSQDIPDVHIDHAPIPDSSFSIGDEDEDDTSPAQAAALETVIEIPGLDVARAATPPPHAQFSRQQSAISAHASVPSEENPWA